MMRTLGKLTLNALVLFLAASGAVHAAAGGEDSGFQQTPANNDITNQASLQRGAKYYMNYCLGCHSLEYVRYQRIAQDLNIPEEVMLENLAFTGDKIGDMVLNAMPAEDSEEWFGLAVPDLSLVARSRNPDWIYNFLRSFYLDESTETGTNNMMLPNAAMPHVLWPLQGIQKATWEEDEEGHRSFAGFETVREGRLTTEEYDRTVRDIVNFLDYVGEPVQAERKRIGFWVLAFIGVFIFLAILLKKEFWRDIK